MEHLENAPESQSETEGEGALQGGGDIGFLAPGNAIIDTVLITGFDQMYCSQDWMICIIHRHCMAWHILI